MNDKNTARLWRKYKYSFEKFTDKSFLPNSNMYFWQDGSKWAKRYGKGFIQKFLIGF